MTDWFDSHCHFDFPELADRWSEHWAEARAAGVSGLLIPGVEPAQWPRARLMAAQLEVGGYWAAGLHPLWIERQQGLGPDALGQLLADQLGLLAIGECGLDGSIELPLEQQLPWLRVQLAIAVERDLPVILHQRAAHNELIRELKRFPRLRGILHGFSGSIDMAREYRRAGLLLGIGGVITYPRANKTRNAVAALAAADFLLETDAPCMPLMGHQGEPNRPALLAQVASAVAGLRGETVAVLAAQLQRNLVQLFPSL